MSERTAPALSRLDAFAAVSQRLPVDAHSTQLAHELDALRRAVSAFHMEAIRFRMYSCERLLGELPDGPHQNAVREAFEALRSALETAGFHTRSHAAPDKPAKA